MSDTATAAQTRAAIARAASAFTLSLGSGVRQGGCDFLNSHRDGPCTRCIARDEHDAEMVRRGREARSA